LNIGEIDEILCDASNLKEDRTLSSTERKALIDSRLGQGMFRDAVVNYWKACALTRYQRVDLLKAGHIKPWRECSNRERLNKFNGILLTPNFHEVFDKGLISFTNNGKILISCDLSEADKAHLGITDKMHIKISDEHKKYFDFHRKRIFIR
jgi:predicted restriction endonuclease